MNKKIENLLKKQIQIEFEAYVQYLNFYVFCSLNGFFGSSNFFKKQHEEERNHMMKIFDFLLDEGIEVELPNISIKKKEITSLKEIFEKSFEFEKKVSDHINEIYGLCLEEKDFKVLNFINWFVEEQREEEKVFKKILDIFKVLSDDKISLFLVDKEISKI